MAETGKPPSAATLAANAALREYLRESFEDNQDFDDCARGFIVDHPTGVIMREDGTGPAYNINDFKWLGDKTKDNWLTDMPDTVNPALWRQSILNAKTGLFKVTEKLYQVRSWDISNISFVRGNTGWIVIDPLTCNETAAAALKCLRENVEDVRVSALIITHSHADHFGGVKGVISQEDVDAGKLDVIAPKEFYEASVSENLMAGLQMSRRATYMYGNLLPKDKVGTLGSGLGTTSSTGVLTILRPTIEIPETPTDLVVDGVPMQFMYTPGAEAPSELMAYIPSLKAMLQAEEINKTQHNLYSLRGAKVRNGLDWSKYIHDVIERYGKDCEISFGSHHWPTWGNSRIVKFWEGQRDTYRYLHDETLRLANHGYTMLEIAEQVTLPDSLAKNLANRGYYGSVNHNAKAQYQMYFGWFSGNPSELHELPPEEEGKKFVEYMGGANNVIAKARQDFEKGEYRWVCTALNHVVFANPNNSVAKNLLADAQEQLGYQAESGPWRNFYLTGAQELRYGVVEAPAPDSTSPDMVRGLDLVSYLDYLAMCLNHPEAADEEMAFNAVITGNDGKQHQVIIRVQNAVMNYTIGSQLQSPDATITTDHDTLTAIQLGDMTVLKALASGKMQISGEKKKAIKFFGLIERPTNFWFNIVTPKPSGPGRSRHN